jgi:hypothetical protein
MVVEYGLEDITPTLGFNSQMPEAKDVESPNSHMVVAVSLDDIPFPLGVDVKVPHSPMAEVNLFHVFSI